jgi:hypothetical protein
VDFQCQGERRRDTLMFAEIFGRTEIAEILRKAGAKK